MAATSLEAVKRKIRFLQEQADGAEEKAEKLQMQLLVEKKAREQVSIFFFKKNSVSSQTGAAIAKPSSCSLLLCVMWSSLSWRTLRQRRPQCCELSFMQWHHCTHFRLMPSGFNWSLTGPSRNGYWAHSISVSTFSSFHFTRISMDNSRKVIDRQRLIIVAPATRKLQLIFASISVTAR